MKLPARLSNNKQTHGEVLKTALSQVQNTLDEVAFIFHLIKDASSYSTVPEKKLSTIPSWLSDSEE